MYYYPHEKNTIIYSKYYSVFEPYYNKVYYTVDIAVFTTLCSWMLQHTSINYIELINCNKYCSIL